MHNEHSLNEGWMNGAALPKTKNRETLEECQLEAVMAIWLLAFG